MNTLSIPVVAMASISLYVGSYRLLIYTRRRKYREDLTFAILCFVIVFYDAFCVGLYNSASVSEGVQWQRAQFISLAVFVPAFLWFVSDYTHQKPGTIIHIYEAFYLLAIIVQLVDRSSLTFLIDQPSIKHIVLFRSLTITYYEATLGLFSSIQSWVGMIASAYILIIGIRYFKSGHKQEAMPLILAIVLMYAAGLNDTLVSNGLYHFVYLMEYAYLATISVMAYSLSNTVVEAAIAKDALKKSEERFRSLVETTSDWVWEVNADGLYTYSSPKVYDVLGYGPREIIGRRPFDFMPPDEAKRVSAIFQETVQNEKPLERAENINIKKDGGLVVLETSGVPFFDEHGKLLGYRGIDRDITERKRTEQALELSEKKFYEAFHSSPVMMTIEGEDHKFIDVNQAFLDGLGYSREEVLGKSGSELNLWTSVEDTQKVQKMGAEQNSVYNFEMGFRRKSGEVGTILLSNDKFEVNGKSYELTSGLDITERRQMADRIFEQKELAEVTLRSIGDAVITTNIDRLVEFLNPVAENLTGWKMEEAIGQNLIEVFRVINEESRKPVVDPVERCLREGRAVGLANHSVLISRDGHEFSIDDSAAPIRNRRGEIIGTVLVFHDVTEERRLSLQVAHDAMHDSLTGLVNRREFDKRLERALMSTKERNISHVLCYLDLDQFKIVNDTAGHAAGDELLKQVARLLRGMFRQRDTLARLGGDEFGLLLENCQLDHAVVICNDILARIRDSSFLWEGNSFQVGVSIGIVPITTEKQNINQLLSQADVACYTAKDLGRNRVYVYQTEDSETSQRHSEILQAAHMKDAIIHEQFLLYCQPIAQLTGEHSSFSNYEVLLRMLSNEKDLVLPSVFIPPAERYGLMPTIDRWVIRQTFSTMSKYAVENVQITINLSGNSLDDDDLLEYVLQQLQEFSIPANHICFEITETAAIHHLNKAQTFIHGFRERGGKIALDDFGSGFSSFRYLKSLAVDYIKIDGAFVSDMLANPGDQAMVEAITRVAHTLGIYVIAEHATNQETVNRLREIGVEGVQGFGIGFPVPVEEAWTTE